MTPDLNDPYYRASTAHDATEPYESAPEWYYWFGWAIIAACALALVALGSAVARA